MFDYWLFHFRSEVKAEEVEAQEERWAPVSSDEAKW